MLRTSTGDPELLARDWDGKVWFWEEHFGGQDHRPEAREEAGQRHRQRAGPPWARPWVWRGSPGVGSEGEDRTRAPLNFVPGSSGGQ